jgi:hypothetical protein
MGRQNFAYLATTATTISSTKAKHSKIYKSKPLKYLRNKQKRRSLQKEGRIVDGPEGTHQGRKSFCSIIEPGGPVARITPGGPNAAPQEYLQVDHSTVPHSFLHLQKKKKKKYRHI